MRRAAQFTAAWLLTTLAAALPAAAQCAMCAKAVEAGGPRAIGVLKQGILTLLIPTLLIFASIGLMVYRRRKHHMAESELAEMPQVAVSELPASVSQPII